MALVAYSDESDLSEEEDDNHKEAVPISQPVTVSKLENLNGTLSHNSHLLSGINSIVDDDDDVIQTSNHLDVPSQLNDSESIEGKHISFPVPTVNPNNTTENGIINEEQDIVDDVPTVNTWTVTKNMKKFDKNFQHSIEPIKRKKNEKNKLQFILPSLAELQDDESEDDQEVNSFQARKKFQPSACGTGLFAILPKPKHTSSSLIPNSVSRIKNVKPVGSIKKFPTNLASKQKLPVISKTEDDSDDDLETGTEDFFSLHKPPEVIEALPIPVSEIDTTEFINVQSCRTMGVCDMPLPCAKSDISQEKIIENESNIPDVLIPQPDSEDTEAIDQEALLRLRGRRNKEIVNVIDINADDALMSRHEWMTRSLSEAKPTKSFSTKKDGNPTQLQRRKHQITFLAHQAQEREQDLQKTWGQNRFTKMQTQSKYGF